MRTAKACDVAVFGSLILMVLNIQFGYFFLATVWATMAIFNAALIVVDVFLNQDE